MATSDRAARRPGPGRPQQRVPFDDSDLAKKVFSPTCTYCEYWKPTDGQHCDAYPRGGKLAIPEKVWDGTLTHVFPLGNEQKRNGKPIVFEVHPAVAPGALPKKIKADLAKREKGQQEKQQEQK